jgi:hypothetical protein
MCGVSLIVVIGPFRMQRYVVNGPGSFMEWPYWPFQVVDFDLLPPLSIRKRSKLVFLHGTNLSR